MKKKGKTKLLISIFTMLSIFSGMLSASNVTKATSGETVVDVTPPFVRLSIEGASQSNGVNYVSETEVEVEIYAYDDTCAASEIQYYISETPIDNTQPLDEGLWNNYQIGLTKTLTITDLTATNTIYAMFRDKTGNTTLIYEGADIEYTINYHTNTGESNDIMYQDTGYHGMAYILINDVPKREGYYFLGWATSSTATSGSYEQGDIISAEAFKGSDKVIDLYAIWTNSIEALPLLADKVKIGDYVDYPVDYENVNEANKTGWRVISKDIDLDGNESIGTVNIVSAGCPISYYHTGDVNVSYENLTTNFLTTEFDDITVQQKYIKNGLAQYSTLTEAFSNQFTKLKEGIPQVRSLITSDVTRITTTFSDLGNVKYEDLWGLWTRYWVATIGYYNNFDRVSANMVQSAIAETGRDAEAGIRPVVSLKIGIRTSEKDNMGRWTLLLNE